MNTIKIVPTYPYAICCLEHTTILSPVWDNLESVDTTSLPTPCTGKERNKPIKIERWENNWVKEDPLIDCWRLSELFLRVCTSFNDYFEEREKLGLEIIDEKQALSLIEVIPSYPLSDGSYLDAVIGHFEDVSVVCCNSKIRTEMKPFLATLKSLHNNPMIVFEYGTMSNYTISDCPFLNKLFCGIALNDLGVHAYKRDRNIV